jgi:protein gp37
VTDAGPLAAAHELARHEATIGRGLSTFVEVGRALVAIRDGRLYRGTHATFEEYCRQRWDFDRTRAYQLIDAAGVVDRVSTIVDTPPATESQARPLARLPVAEQPAAWARAVDTAPNGRVTATHVARVVSQMRRPGRQPGAVVTLTAWHAMTRGEQERLIAEAPRASRAGMTDHRERESNAAIEWALWSRNVVTGCEHDCPYCYARDIAERWFAGYGFEPAFHPDRLHSPRNVKPRPGGPGANNIFCDSMADLFGKWVPQEWIDAELAVARECPQWNFLYLTKFPQRMAQQDWPENAWVGTSVDRQARVATAERVFARVRAGVRWLSCEPMLERLTFSSLEGFDWIVIGAATASSQTPAFKPPDEWIDHLIKQADAAGCPVYLKTNLRYRRRYPTPRRPLDTEQATVHAGARLTV